MDILFAPPNIGALPSSAMAEVEIKTEAMRTSSLQQMLDLERKYKMDRLHSAPASPPASPPPTSEAAFGRPPLQIRRADSLSQKQNVLMLKAARRSTAPPPLSITIPEPPASGRGRDSSRHGQSSDPQQVEEEDDDGDDTETETTAEPLHKQVKFLAPDDEDEGDMSDQSSICQSPSWEGYGQRKKDKKKEAERKKREKEQAEKEAKAAKKQLASTGRLSKPPPPSKFSRSSSMVGITNAERSMSDPLFTTTLQSLAEGRPTRGIQNDERASSTNDLKGRNEAETGTSKGFMGGVKPDKEKGNRMQSFQASVYPPSLPYQLIQTSGPEPKRVGSLSPTMPGIRHENRSPRESAFPPSSSRTPALRHMSASTHSRSNSLLQGAASFFRGQEGKPNGESESGHPQAAPGNERGRQTEQGVHRRSQSTSRATGGSQGHVNGSASSSSRSSSRNTQRTRRSSISQDAKAIAMKISGMKTTPSAKDEQSAYGSKNGSQVDYFNFMERSYSTSVLSAMVSGGDPAARPDTRETIRQSNGDSTSTREAKTQEPAPMSRQSSSQEPSIAGSQGKKGRSLKDAAKAALNIGTATNGSKPAVSAPPYLAFRARMQSQNNKSGNKKLASAHSEQVPAPTPVPLPTATVSQGYIPIAREDSSGQPSSSNSVKTADLVTQAGSRASEGSSSTSSAYEDGSPLPSPNTTPDTSRPQSSKDMPLHSEETTEAREDTGIQDDETTLRQSSDGSVSSHSSTTPRLAGSTELDTSEMSKEEKWSRTALPVEMDGEADAQSFTTSVSHQDDAEDVSKKATYLRQDATQSHAEILKSVKMSMSQPKLSKSMSDTALRPAESDIITQNVFLPLQEKPISIPARSKKRISPVESQGGLPREEVKQALRDSQRDQDKYREEPAKTTRHEREHEGRPSERQSESKSDIRERTRPEQEFRSVEEPETKKESRRERHGGKRRHHDRERDRRAESDMDNREALDRQEMEQTRNSASTPSSGASMTRNSTSSSLPSSNSSQPSLKSPRKGGFQENTRHSESQEPVKARSSPAGSRVSTPEPTTLQSKPPGPARVVSAPTPTTETSSMLPVAPLTPSASRPPGPVSILKQPTRSTSDPVQLPGSTSSSSSRPQNPHVLSALPKHMQLQAGISGGRPPPPHQGTPESSRMAPIAKMLVQCCECKFYHDMPSTVYECMANPDSVVEDRTLGISGAITTMVKCPWCRHNMTTSCCAGYAAVVYLKEKLH
ncbi:hypothetical protein V8F20_010185 [Naviculisporaceae sp. PSN 640]